MWQDLSFWLIGSGAHIGCVVVGGNPKGVWGALRGQPWFDGGTGLGGIGGDFVLLGDEFGVLRGEDWWFWIYKITVNFSYKYSII